MAGFVQIMEFDSSKIGEVDALGRELAAAMGDRFKPKRAITTEDRDRPGHCFVIVEFDSYEEAMENSEDPTTAEYSRKMGALVDGPPTFHNLDIVGVWEA
jgi:hypothetical protein